MSETAYVGALLKNYKDSPLLDGFTRVVLEVSEDVSYAVGSESGRTLTTVNPFGTEAMAKNILNLIKGYKYKPYTAESAILDPAAELGDGVTVAQSYSGIYSMETFFGGKYRATISAPADEELDHEYPYKSSEQRQITRKFQSVRAEFKIQADKIAAEVSKTKDDVTKLESQLSIQADKISAKVSKSGGDGASFGWELNETSWTLKSGGSEVLKATKTGITITGKIKATSGTIGGFTINSDYISYNKQTWGGTNKKGIYIGVSGIQLGKNFKVDAQGNLEANSGTFKGNVSAKNIKYGGDNGTMNGSGITGGSISGGTGGQISSGSITNGNVSSGINTSLGYADRFYGATIGDGVTEWYSSYLYTAQLYVDGYRYKPTWLYFTDSSGNPAQMRVLALSQ